MPSAGRPDDLYRRQTARLTLLFDPLIIKGSGERPDGNQGLRSSIVKENVNGAVRVEGLISFGLVSVPIRLLSAARAPHVNFMKFIGSAARVLPGEVLTLTALILLWQRTRSRHWSGGFLSSRTSAP